MKIPITTVARRAVAATAVVVAVAGALPTPAAASPTPQYRFTKRAKAKPDECFNGIGQAYPAGPPCKSGHAKVIRICKTDCLSRKRAIGIASLLIFFPVKPGKFGLVGFLDLRTEQSLVDTSKRIII